MNEAKWKKEMEELDKLIEAKNLKIDKSHYYTNGYDAPFKLWNRKNEVWRVKLEDPEWFKSFFFTYLPQYIFVF